MAENDFAFIDSLEQSVGQWKNILLQGNKRNYLKEMENPEEDGLISLPDSRNSGQWSIENKERLSIAEKMIENTTKVGQKIEQMQKLAKGILMPLRFISG